MGPPRCSPAGHRRDPERRGGENGEWGRRGGRGKSGKGRRGGEGKRGRGSSESVRKQRQLADPEPERGMRKAHWG